MHIVAVEDQPDRIREFLELPLILYRDHPKWIRPLDQDIEEVFDPKRNKRFRHGNAKRWILQTDQHVTIGRVAAFYDTRLFKAGAPKVGGLGFFECINQPEASRLLFQTCEDWLRREGLEGVDGSVNFGDRDKHWGILIDGFDREPNYGMPYTLPYYPGLFEHYGFRVFYYQHTYHRSAHTPLSDKIMAKYERIRQDPAYTFCHWENAQADRFIKAFSDIYNQAWSRHSGVTAMPESHVRALFKKLKPVMDKRLLWFGFHGDRPICFFLMLPELNQVFKHVNGKLDWLGKLKFLWYRHVRRSSKMFGVVFGVIPDFQGKGLEGAVVVACKKTVLGAGYDEIEMNWIGDFNPKMIHLMESLNASLVKRHATYRLYFDRNFPFEREKDIA